MQCPRMECHNSEINSNIIVGVCFLASRTGEQIIWWKYEEWDSSFYQTLILFTWIILRNFQIMTRHTSICQLPVFLRWTAFSGNFSEFGRNRRNFFGFLASKWNERSATMMTSGWLWFVVHLGVDTKKARTCREFLFGMRNSASIQTALNVKSNNNLFL